MLFLVVDKASFTDLPLSLIASNNVGTWSALLYPLLVLVMVQALVEAERKAKLFTYGRSYRRAWFDLLWRKAAVVFGLLLLVTALNLIYNFLLLQTASEFMEAANLGELQRESSLNFIALLFSFIPLIFFQLMLSILVKKTGISYLLSILLLILGIPIANLTNIMVNPFSFGIAVMKPGVGLFSLVPIGTLVILISIFVANYTLKK